MSFVTFRDKSKENPMKSREKFWAMGAALVCGGLMLTGSLISSPRGRTDDQGDETDSRIRIGFAIAPVQLNLEGKNPALVGLGSYIVNTEGCNDCHSAGPPTQYAQGGNPYLGQPKVVNTKTYLGGGRDFGTVFSPLIAGPESPHIISRNLTPAPNNKTGLPGGDITPEDFLKIITTGKDFDGLHPNCSVNRNTNCFSVNAPPIPSVDGDLLQVMPWPNFKDLKEREILAIYEYLKAVPCVQGNYPGPNGAAAGIPPEPADRCSQ
jgi:hypothetical protein